MSEFMQQLTHFKKIQNQQRFDNVRTRLKLGLEAPAI